MVALSSHPVATAAVALEARSERTDLTLTLTLGPATDLVIAWTVSEELLLGPVWAAGPTARLARGLRSTWPSDGLEALVSEVYGMGVLEAALWVRDLESRAAPLLSLMQAMGEELCNPGSSAAEALWGELKLEVQTFNGGAA